jgi:hypothetical protein
LSVKSLTDPCEKRKKKDLCIEDTRETYKRAWRK